VPRSVDAKEGTLSRRGGRNMKEKEENTKSALAVKQLGDAPLLGAIKEKRRPY